MLNLRRNFAESSLENTLFGLEHLSPFRAIFNDCDSHVFSSGFRIRVCETIIERLYYNSSLIMERIVFLDRSTLIADVRRPRFHHEWMDYETSAPAEVVERLRSATIAITNKVQLRAAELSQLPELKFIAVAATGTDIIDLDYCRRRNLPVSNIRNHTRHTLPEHVFMLILSLRRNLLQYRSDIERGEWQRASGFCLLTHEIRDLYASTLGIIGYGALGQSVGRLAQAFG